MKRSAKKGSDCVPPASAASLEPALKRFAEACATAQGRPAGGQGATGTSGGVCGTQHSKAPMLLSISGQPCALCAGHFIFLGRCMGARVRLKLGRWAGAA